MCASAYVQAIWLEGSPPREGGAGERVVKRDMRDGLDEITYTLIFGVPRLESYRMKGDYSERTYEGAKRQDVEERQIETVDAVVAFDWHRPCVPVRLLPVFRTS